MDPFSQVLCIVVVVLVLIIIYVAAQGDIIHIYTEHVIFKTFLCNVEQIYQKDAACATDNTFTDTLTNTVDISKNKLTQTDDSELFITCYDHVQAQHQENLIAVDTIENMIDYFHTSLQDILEHSNWNFQVLAYQLRSEFHGYMQYALSQAASMVIPVPEPIDFQSLHIEHYAHYEKHEIQEADEEIKQEERGARPKDPTRPWTIQPIECRTHSQASFVRWWAWQENIFRRRDNNRAGKLY